MQAAPTTPGQRLRALRDQHHLSRRRVADQLGASERAVYGWERDEYMPQGDALLALAMLYAVSPEYIETGNDDDETPDVRQTLARHSEQLSRIERGVDAIWTYIQQVQQVRLPPEQLEALAALERQTDQLERLLRERQSQTALSARESDVLRATRQRND